MPCIIPSWDEVWPSKKLIDSTESALKGARTVQMLLPHLSHNYSQITAYMPVKRRTFYETKVLRVWVKSLNTWWRSTELRRYTQPPNTTEVGWFCVWSPCLSVCAPPFDNTQTASYVYLTLLFFFKCLITSLLYSPDHSQCVLCMSCFLHVT